MAISLKKGQKVDLTKDNPGLKKILVGLGWDVRATVGKAFDLDASAFLLNAAGKVRSEKDFVFYKMEKINGKLISPCGSVEHTGDNRTGQGDGDDEALIVDLTKIPQDVVKILFTVTLYDEENKQTFGQVTNAFIRLVDQDTGVELKRYDLSEDFSTETAVEFAAIYRKDGEWRLEAIGQGYEGGLEFLCGKYGIEVE